MARLLPEERAAMQAALADDERRERERRIDEALGPVPFDAPRIRGALAMGPGDAYSEPAKASVPAPPPPSRADVPTGAPRFRSNVEAMATTVRRPGAIEREVRRVTAAPAAGEAVDVGGKFAIEAEDPNERLKRRVAEKYGVPEQELEEEKKAISKALQRKKTTKKQAAAADDILARAAKYGGQPLETGEEATQEAGTAAVAAKQRGKGAPKKKEEPAETLDPDVRAVVKEEFLSEDTEDETKEVEDTPETFESELEHEAGVVTEPEEPDPTEGLTRTGVTVQRAPVDIDPLEQSQLDESAQETLEAREDLEESQLAGADAEAFARRAEGYRADQIRKDFERREQVRLDAEQRMLQGYADLQKEIESEKLEEPTIWSGDFGTDLLRGIGAMLVGLGGGPQMAMDHINRKIDQNLQMQKEKLAKRKGDLNRRGTLLERARLRFGDERQADAAARASAFAKLQGELANWESFAKTPEKKAQIRMAMAEAKRQEVLSELKLKEATSDVLNEQYQMLVEQPRGGGGPAKSPMELETESLEKYNDWLKAKGLQREWYVPDLNGYALSENDAKLLKASSVQRRNMSGALNELIRLNNGVVSGHIPKSEAMRKSLALHKNVAIALKEMSNLGVLSESDMSLLMDQVPEPGVFTVNADAAYKQTLANTNRAFRSEAVGRGIVDGPQPLGLREQEAQTFKREETE